MPNLLRDSTLFTTHTLSARHAARYVQRPEGVVVRYDIEFTTRQYLIYHTHAAGYIQRRLIKALEDVVVRYDGTGLYLIYC